VSPGCGAWTMSRSTPRRRLVAVFIQAPKFTSAGSRLMIAR
jgi:hypothetical protein